jgi:(1->4)-alpha-D-glucan 1-alpha-D-glucosylmutase
MASPIHPPPSTYRLQITPEFSLHHAAALTGYLARLGVGAVYVSPLLRATSGSLHGYDVVDHGTVDPARGGDDGLRALSRACRQEGLDLVVDIVPNHMGVADPIQNEAWWKLLRLGPGSATASWFDVDWESGGGQVLLPVLADEFDPRRDLIVEGGELRYFDHRYPIAPGTSSPGSSGAEIHPSQHYLLINFRRADTEQNYRRFFAISDLAGLRVEDPAVYHATHREILRWLRHYGVTGLRIDHPDGLADPLGYLQRLAGDAPGVWITVEKILARGESLPESWPVAGTTGYDALAEISRLFVDPGAESAFDQIYRDLTGDDRSWAEHVTLGKEMVTATMLQAEIRRIARLVPTVERVEEALAAVAVSFDTYRSYLPQGSGELERAVAGAGGRHPDLAGSIGALLPRLSDPDDEVCVRFQQLTGAVMAKGVEDTAFYRYNRFIALNEVGGDPGIFGLDPEDFHSAQKSRMASRPAGMTTLSTHDTKRGEDLRARLMVLAEVPAEWEVTVRRLLELAPVPNPAFGYLLWQTVVGTGLIERGRMHAYAEKAMREAADGTGWVDPVASFERSVHAAVDAAYDDPEVRTLIVSMADVLEPYGWSNSLAQKLVQLTMPGVPDLYQGAELVEGSLADPDNRRPVDFTELAALLTAAEGTAAGPETYASPLAKLWLTRQALHARRHRPELFSGYHPLWADRVGRRHLVAFDRGGAITAVTRLPVGLERTGGWGDSTLELPPGEYEDVLTGRRCRGTVAVAELLGQHPAALLVREAP